MRKSAFILICLIALSPAISRAETIIHNFDALNGASAIAYSNSNTVGQVHGTDTVYTCSGTNAKFYSDVNTSYLLCICLPRSGNQVVLTPAISDLDSIHFTYNPNAYREIKVYTSTDNDTWTEQTVRLLSPGNSSVQLPTTGNYFVKFRNPSGTNDFYIREIKYITKPSECHCLRVVSE